MRSVILALGCVLFAAAQVHADVKSKAVQEAAEAVMSRFGATAERSLPSLMQKIESLATRYGDEALVAVKRVGPEAFSVVEQAGVNGQKAVSIMARYGEEGATNVLRRPKAMSQFLRYGDEAAAALVKHPGVAEPLLEKGGMSAVKALGEVTPRQARRLAMLMDGEVGKLPGSEKLFDVIGKYGQKACDFIWENKGSLAVGGALIAFVANPEPFLNGTSTLVKSAGEVTAKPLAEGIANGTNWTLIVLAIVGAGGAIIAVKLGLLRQNVPHDAAASALPARPADVHGGVAR